MVANKRCLFCSGELGEVLFENVRDYCKKVKTLNQGGDIHDFVD